MKCSNHYPIALKWKEIEVTYDYTVWKCPNCGEQFKINNHHGNIGGQKVNAIYKDEHGNEIAVNKKGNVVENKYKNDSRGYKRAGKKISRYDSHNRVFRDEYH